MGAHGSHWPRHPRARRCSRGSPGRWAPGWHQGLPGWQSLQQLVARGWHGLQPLTLPLVLTRIELGLDPAATTGSPGHPVPPLP